ncbi:hypothetical protein RFI_14456, partial [Reticulomyxa filosa]
SLLKEEKEQEEEEEEEEAMMIKKLVEDGREEELIVETRRAKRGQKNSSANKLDDSLIAKTEIAQQHNKKEEEEEEEEMGETRSEQDLKKSHKIGIHKGVCYLLLQKQVMASIYKDEWAPFRINVNNGRIEKKKKKNNNNNNNNEEGINNYNDNDNDNVNDNDKNNDNNNNNNNNDNENDDKTKEKEKAKEVKHKNQWKYGTQYMVVEGKDNKTIEAIVKHVKESIEKNLVLVDSGPLKRQAIIGTSGSIVKSIKEKFDVAFIWEDDVVQGLFYAAQHLEKRLDRSRILHLPVGQYSLLLANRASHLNLIRKTNDALIHTLDMQPTSLLKQFTQLRHLRDESSSQSQSQSQSQQLHAHPIPSRADIK